MPLHFKHAKQDHLGEKKIRNLLVKHGQISLQSILLKMLVILFSPQKLESNKNTRVTPQEVN